MALPWRCQFRIVGLKLWLYIKGIRFYKTSKIQIDNVFSESTFKLTNGDEIHFQFSKEIYHNMLLKRGRVYHTNYIAFIVHATFPNSTHLHAERYNNIKFCVREQRLKNFCDQHITKVLLDLYISFIEHDLKTLKNE